jgi:hypothetical protein
MDEVARGWRELHNEEIDNLYPSPNIIRMIKTLRMRWAGNVSPLGTREKHTCSDIKPGRKDTTRKTKT